MSNYIKEELIAEEFDIKDEITEEQGYDFQVAISQEEQNVQVDLLQKNFLKEHIETKAKKRFSCRLCGKRFLTANKLKWHKVTHSDKSLKTTERNYKCDQCDKVFKAKIILTRHKNEVHVDKRNYKCYQCDKVFKAKRTLTKHETAVHATERDYKCDQCDNAFKTKLVLNMHKNRVHVTERDYKCDQCDKAYKAKIDLVHHKIKIHATEGAFQCQACSKTFASANYLRKHFTSHHKINCNLCDHKCKDKKDLLHHKLNVHPIVEMIENVKEIDEVKVEPNVIYDTESKREVIKEEPEGLDQSVIDMEVKNEPVECRY